MTIIEVIRKGIKYADEFELIGEVRHNTKLDIPELLQCPNGSKYFLQGVEKDLVVFPLLLSRIIEGINRADNNIAINQAYSYIRVENLILWNSKVFSRCDFKNDDECKLAAITYVLEQEEK